MSALNEIQDVLNKLGQLSAKVPAEQQGPLLDVFKSAYINLLNTFNMKESEDVSEYAEESIDEADTPEEAKSLDVDQEVYDEEEEEDEDVEEDNEEDDEVVITAEKIRDLKEILLFIGEKLYQQGRAVIDLFSRFDATSTNAVSIVDFKAALASIGVYLLREELRMIYKQFGAEVQFSDDMDPEPAIKYRDFIGYTEALRGRSFRSAQSDSFASMMAKRAQIIMQAAQDDARERKNVKVPFKARLALAMKAMREHLYSRSLSVPYLFKVLNQGAGAVPTSVLAESLPKFGFPANVCPPTEVAAYLADKDTETEGQLNYAEFCAFMQGSEPVDTEAAVPKHILADQSLVNALVKLNSMPLRAHFKEVDEDIDGLLSVDDIISDLITLGIRAETARNPALPEFIATFAQKTPGMLSYSEYLQFVNARIGTVTQPAVISPLNVEVPSHFTPADLVQLVNQHIKRGISLETIFANLAEHGSSRIGEAALWHALTSIGFDVSNELSSRLFHLLGPQVAEEDADDEAAEPTLDYHELAVTFLYPNRNPRIGSSRGRQAPGGEDNVPLGSGVDRLQHEFVQLSIGEKKRAVSRKKFTHSHKFDNEDVDARLAQHSAQLEKIKSNPRKGNSSTVNLADHQTGEIVDPASFGAKKKKADHGLLAASSIDFLNDHGGAAAAKPMKSTLNAPKTSIHLRMDDMVPVVANEQQSKSNSDIFGVKGTDIPKQKRLLRAAATTTQTSTVSFNQDDFEEYVPVKARICPPGGRSSVVLSHDDAPGDALGSTITGARKRSTNKPSDTLVLDYDEDRALSDAAQLSIAGAARKHFTVKAHMGGSGAQVGGSPAVGARKRQSRITQSTLSLESTSLDGLTDADIVSRFDSMLMPDDMVVEDVDERQHDVSGIVSALCKEVYAQGKVKKVFSDWSKGNSTLTKAQLIEGAKSVYVTVDDAAANTLMKIVDKDGKGALTFGEFVRLLSSSN